MLAKFPAAVHTRFELEDASVLNHTISLSANLEDHQVEIQQSNGQFSFDMIKGKLEVLAPKKLKVKDIEWGDSPIKELKIGLHNSEQGEALAILQADLKPFTVT